ncbi:MAG TPA: amidohydrolase family protein [Chloroflexota bacterium]|nr:amidohydrolase family protein [Chloroflexota bacterium]
MPPLKVDVHAHLYSREYLAELDRIFANPQTPRERATAATLQGKIKKDSAMWNAEERLEFLDSLDVQYQVLSLSVPQAYEGSREDRLKLARVSNDDFANTVAKHPKRFLGFASLPLPHVDDSLKELDRCLGELGMVGVCLGTNVDANWLDDPALRPVFDELDRREAVIFLHPLTAACVQGVTDFNMSADLAYVYDTAASVYRMLFSGMFDQYRKLKLIVPHLGGMLPALIGRFGKSYQVHPACQNIQRAPYEYLKEFYYDVVSYWVPALHLAATSFGTDHLLLGSDYPFGIGDLRAAITSVQEAFGAEDRAKIFGENAKRLFPQLTVA